MTDFLMLAVILFAAGISTGFAFRGTIHKELGALKGELYATVLNLENLATLATAEKVLAELPAVAASLRKKL